MDKLGFYLFPIEGANAYMLDVAQDAYALVLNTSKGEFSLDAPVMLAYFEWDGPECSERWAGTYISLHGMLMDFKSGSPWTTRPQCVTNQCRNQPTETSPHCQRCLDDANTQPN